MAQIAELTMHVADTTAAASNDTDIQDIEKAKGAVMVNDEQNTLGVVKEFHDETTKATSVLLVKELEIVDDTLYRDMDAENSLRPGQDRGDQVRLRQS